MAELTAFRYRTGASTLHGLDPRFKIGGLILAGLAILNGDATVLGAWSMACAALFAMARISLPTMARELRYFGILICFVVVARALSVEGTPAVRFAGVALCREGVAEGLLAGWRLGLVVMLGLLLTTTTSVWHMKAAVEFLLSPIPFIPQKRVATMIGLLLRFIPLILSAARETTDAQRARGIENRRNPVFRMVKLAVPLLRRIFLDADRMATAMDARCFTEDRATPSLCARRSDWGFMAAVCGLTALSFAFFRA